MSTLPVSYIRQALLCQCVAVAMQRRKQGTGTGRHAAHSTCWLRCSRLASLRVVCTAPPEPEGALMHQVKLDHAWLTEDRHAQAGCYAVVQVLNNAGSTKGFKEWII